MILHYDHIDSTNRVAKGLIAEGTPNGTIVRAAMQSAGKGQYGRVFESPEGGLYFSLVFEPDLPLDQFPLITLATGLACLRLLKQQFFLSPRIKWPNDIYLAGKKVAGILCENVIKPGPGGPKATVIIGVGMNVNNQVGDFADEIQPLITTLFEHLHRRIDLDVLLTDLTQAIVDQMTRLKRERAAVLAEWQRDDLLKDRTVVYLRDSQSMTGIGLGVTDQGAYRIREDNGREHQVIGGQLRLSSG
ncbi:MAG: biotin--[acetyl-CoA-carboxylase] ligase [Desulfobulbus sp.]|jgi:BirA family biotin operon repressor/biotin-[acetyl-CoA-carboxylase] ligase|uniref:biotin--[acetyl-CoA-carboxylase] ligase n=1 Tax=Desulfobulbus sp. TaxID=895 RepID=UPI00283DCABD|nr:biotin--[acetyl-CoA-carboxylase] ligase [Desulfobulbus sp.]MDR2551480.1 biotin--[acetyl-CoA-carboxylase] ligase [Desulfobulbus sp.]